MLGRLIRKSRFSFTIVALPVNRPRRIVLSSSTISTSSNRRLLLVSNFEKATFSLPKASISSSQDTINRNSNSEKKPIMERWKNVVAIYGKVAIGTHIVVSLASLGIFYLAVSSGVDVSFWLSKIGFAFTGANSIGTFALAYLAHKAILPIRLSISLALTPLISEIFRRKRKNESNDISSSK